MKIKLFTDGSCLGNPGPGGYAAILKHESEKHGKIEKEFVGGEELTTNNRMELFAIIVGLEALKGKGFHVHIVSDSQYCLRGINEWIDGWVSRNWKKVKNDDLWKRYLVVAEHHTITVEWVKGHDGHPENERCDTLAFDYATKVKEGREK